MADDGGGGGCGGGEGRGGSSQRLPMDNLVEAILSNSQALAEALAAERARLEAQRESCEAERRSVEELQAAVREKDAEIDRLRAEAADAKTKLQADASRKMRWEAAHELLLGANQKLAELREADMEDSRTCAETPNSKETESCTKLNQDTVGHIASDLSAELRKLKQAYETLSSNKDKEVSALLSENDFLRSQLSIVQKDYANKKVEAAQATEAALKVQQSVDELKVLAQKKDDEIGRLQAEAEGAKTNLQKMHSVVKENYDKTLRLQARIPDDDLRHTKDSNETLQKSRSDDPAVCGKSENNVGKDGQDEASQKRRRVSSVSNCPQGVTRPHQQLPSASPSASASAAAGLIKLNVPEQQRQQWLHGFHGRSRGRGQCRSLVRCPVVQRQSCDQAEIFLFEVEEEKEKQQPEEQPHQRGLAHQRQRHPA